MSRSLNLEIQGHSWSISSSSLTNHPSHWPLSPLTSIHQYSFPYGLWGFPPHRLPFHLLILPTRWSCPIMVPGIGWGSCYRLIGFLGHCCLLVAVVWTTMSGLVLASTSQGFREQVALAITLLLQEIHLVTLHPTLTFWSQCLTILLYRLMLCLNVLWWDPNSLI